MQGGVHAQLARSFTFLRSTALHSEPEPSSRYGAPSAEEHGSVLWFDKAATDFTEAFLVGNGKLGGVVSFGVFEDVMQVSEVPLYLGQRGLHFDLV